MKFIDEMRERPEDERLAFSIIAAGAVALILFLLWGATFFRSNKNIVQVEVSEQVQSASVSGSLKSFGDNVTGTVNEFSAQYSQMKEALNEAGLGEKPEGINTVELTVDDNGDVHVGNIIVEKESLNTDETDK